MKTETLILLGLAGVAIYLLTRPTGTSQAIIDWHGLDTFPIEWGYPPLPPGTGVIPGSGGFIEYPI